MAKKVLYSIIIICLILSSALILVSFARGYRVDFDNKNLTSTGILAIASSPDGAAVYANGKLVTATNSSINLAPDFYDVKVEKVGYIPWQKRLRIQGEIATKLDVLLLPVNPTLKPLTSLGVIGPVLSPTQTKLAYIVPFDASASGDLQKKAGIWVWNLKEGPVLPIGSGPRHTVTSTSILDYNDARLIWSPDETQLLAAFYTQNQDTSNDQITTNDKMTNKSSNNDRLLSTYLLDTETENQIPSIVTSTLPTILADWQSQNQEKETAQKAAIPKKLDPVLDQSIQNIRFSADETKFMYQATSSATIPLIINPPLIGANSTKEERDIKPGNTYIYDIKEDKNFLIKKGEPAPQITPANAIISPTPSLSDWLNQNDLSLSWYPDSKHIIMVDNDTIYVAEYDGQNKTTVYAGPFENTYVFPWPGGGRILILTNLNKTASLSPNLYAVDIR